MEFLIVTLLCICLTVLLYTYVGYPVLLLLWCRLKPSQRVDRRTITPSVSIVIPAWNEADRLEARITNCLKLHYPKDQLEIIIVSDGSTDEIGSVVHPFKHRGVRFARLNDRSGKAVALSVGVAIAQGDIIVFADARQRFAPDAIEHLVANFNDPTVGAVSGELVLESGSGAGEAEGVGLYWRLEKWIRRQEAVIDSVIGATGAIYAIRRALYQPLPSGTILDDVMIPMSIVMQGYRVVFETRARAYDQRLDDMRQEFIRKVRTLAGNFQMLVRWPMLLKPWRNRLCLQYISHKVCRLSIPFILILLVPLSVAAQGRVGAYFLSAQVVVYGLALIGGIFSRLGVRERVTGAAFTFCLLNAAVFVGAVRYFSGSQNLWRKTSRQGRSRKRLIWRRPRNCAIRQSTEHSTDGKMQHRFAGKPMENIICESCGMIGGFHQEESSSFQSNQNLAAESQIDEKARDEVKLERML